jgi:hypothetical protein
MKRILASAIILTLAFCLNGCNFIYNLSNYRSTTETFTNALLNRNFDKCIKLMPIENVPNVNLNNLKIGLDTFRSVIVRNFGTKLEYSFMSAEKKISSNKEENLPPNTTLVLIEFHNDKDVGVLQVLFDDKTAKIDNIKTLDVKQPIPDMSKFWMFGFIAIVVLGFNIYTIRLVKRSGLKRKWLNYIAIILLNVPTLQYKAVEGIFFKLLHFQFLLGVGFQKSGYFGSIWEVGIPVGAIFICWKLSRAPSEETDEYLPENYVSPYIERPRVVPEGPSDAEPNKGQ